MCNMVKVNTSLTIPNRIKLDGFSSPDPRQVDDRSVSILEKTVECNNSKLD